MLDLRHDDAGLWFGLMSELVDSIPFDPGYASAALHCLRFLCNPPKYFRKNDSLEMCVAYLEWKATCDLALGVLPRLLKRAHTLPELVQFMSNPDLDSAVRMDFPVNDRWGVDVHILAFLSRASVCINWRIVSAVRRALFATDQKPLARFDEMMHTMHDRPGDSEMTRALIRKRLDPCCNISESWYCIVRLRKC